jgi:hypothetical protein
MSAISEYMQFLRESMYFTPLSAKEIDAREHVQIM